MKVDFIHIGFHKTASTYLQGCVFPQIDRLDVVNTKSSELDLWFYKNFINVNPHSFNKDKFLNGFSERSRSKINTREKVLAISDENISGDIYTGIDSKELMLRTFNVFGNTKVLIVIRNQLDYIWSAYGNYIIHGGTAKFSNWIVGQDTRFGQITQKLKYSYLINDYMNTFGVDNIFVIQYEKLFDDDGLSSFLDMFDLKLPVFNDVRVNQGRNRFGNNVLAILNKIGLNKLKGTQRLLAYFKSNYSERKYIKNLLIDIMPDFYTDNYAVEKIIKQKLLSSYFK